MAAECLSPEATQAIICAAAARAVSRFAAGESPPPFRLDTPITMAIEFNQPEMAEQAALLPGVRRVEGRGIEFTADDMPTAYRIFQAAVALAG